VSGISYHGETSATLAPASWIPVPNSGLAPAHEYRLPLTGHRGFLRIRVSEAP
jgi:hypothetical protein